MPSYLSFCSIELRTHARVSHTVITRETEEAKSRAPVREMVDREVCLILN